jgi:hypothetical protein
MVGEVFKNRADIALNFFMLSTKRVAALDFFSPTYNTK